TTGTHAYSQSDGPFPGIGKTAWAHRGPRSRAGLIAYPVVPPRQRPIAQTIVATNVVSRPVGSPLLSATAEATKTRPKVPTASDRTLAGMFRIAGPVPKTASFTPGSAVSFQCGV